MEKDAKQREEEFFYRKFQDRDVPFIADLIRTVWGYDDMLPKETAKALAMVDTLSALARADYIEIVERMGKPVGFLLGSFRPDEEKHLWTESFQDSIQVAKDTLKHSPGGYFVLWMLPFLNRINRGLIEKSHTPYFAELTYFALDTSCRKKGVGRRLYERFTECLEREGVTGFYLKTDTFSNYHFYDHMGLRRAAVKTIGIPFVKKLQIRFFLYEKTLPEV